jgi:WD40 repeat protein
VVIYGVPFTADSRRLFTASLTNPVTVWDVATAKAVQSIPALGTNNFSLALSPDEHLLAVGGWDGMIKIWDLQNERLLTQFRTNQIPIYLLRFFDQGKTLVSLAMQLHRKLEVRRWDVASWKSISFGPIDVDGVFGFAQSPDRRLLALGYMGKGPVKLWDCASGELKAVLVSGEGGSFLPVFSEDGRLLASPVNNVAGVWDTSSWCDVATLKVHANPVVSVAFSPDGKRLVTGGMVGGKLQPAIQVWDYVSQRELIRLDGVGNWTMWTGFSPDGNTLAALSWHGVAELWHAPSWEEIEAAEKQGQQQLDSRAQMK